MGCKPDHGLDISADPRPTPDVIRVRADSAGPDVLLNACNSSELEFDHTSGADTVLENGARVRISPEKGSHRIKEADLRIGRIVGQLQLVDGEKIPGWEIRTTKPVCLVMVGANYDSLKTLFISSENGSEVASRQPTQVIFKAKKHGRSEGDWISIGGALEDAKPAEAGPRGMIPWLWAAAKGRVFTTQVSCGSNQCCSPKRPPV
ncbi:MAG TPA: hypothetical protein VFM14_04895 [Gemmatimonadales bacterium]|nr:hypothetical protein [Gemmatimonadales bacterium]